MNSENPTENEATWRDLARPFGADEIEWRVGRCGKSDKGIWALLLPYVDSRAIQRRLDAVLGPEGWEDQYHEITGGGHRDGRLLLFVVRGAVDGQFAVDL